MLPRLPAVSGRFTLCFLACTTLLSMVDGRYTVMNVVVASIKDTPPRIIIFCVPLDGILDFDRDGGSSFTPCRTSLSVLRTNGGRKFLLARQLEMERKRKKTWQTLIIKILRRLLPKSTLFSKVFCTDPCVMQSKQAYLVEIAVY